MNRTNARIQAAVAVFGLALVPGVIYGQAKADEPIKVLTICEVFSDPNRYDGQQIAVLGRFDRGGLIDGCCSLIEDHCEKPVVTNGYVWQNRIFDIDGDGKLELITGQSDVGALAYRAQTGELLWHNLADHTQQITAGYILKDRKIPQVVANGRTYGSRGGGGLGAQLYWFDNRGELLSKWPRNPLNGNPNFVRGDWYGDGRKEFFWYKFKLGEDGKGTLFFKEPVYHMFDFLGNGAEQVITFERDVLRVYGYRNVQAKTVRRDSEYRRNSVANHTHY